MASQTMLVQQPVQDYNKNKNTQAPQYWSLHEWNPPVTGEFPSQGPSNAEIIYMSWRHREEIRTEEFHDYNG